MRQQDQFKDYRFIWAIKHHKKKNISIENAKVIEYFSIPYFFYLARSQYWIANCKLPMYVLKKKNQIYLQTWHGTPLKRLAHDIDVSEDTTFYRSGVSYEQMCNSYDVDVARYNYMISPNAFCTKVFQTSFQINRERLIETGYPRNDFISNATKEECDAIKNKYHLPIDKKIVLYAPTWRDNSYVSAGYTFELKANFRKWKEILGEDTIVVFKPHYLIINTIKEDPEIEGYFKSIPAQPEINEIPGKIYMDEETMLMDIKNEVYDYSKLNDFNLYFNNHEDGNASKRVVDILYNAFQ